MDILFLCKRILIDNNFIDGGILVTSEGTIRTILRTQSEVNSWMYSNEADETFDFGNYVLMPALIDTNVNINEPGREDWEGFVTATQAAAAGGFSMIADMPVCSIPPTTSLTNLKAKHMAARGKIFVDVAFWGGLIPENINKLPELLHNGVCGIMCSLSSTGLDEFPSVSANDIDAALSIINGSEIVLAVHAEIINEKHLENNDNNDSKKYDSFLKTREPSSEVEAIALVFSIVSKYDNVKCHILSLSAADGVTIINESRLLGTSITVETCPHYLLLYSEEIPNAQTQYKCEPPIRNRANQEILWKHILNQNINMIVSNHSPCTQGPKMLKCGKNRGNFLTARSGISSIQFGLPLIWTHCQKYGLEITDIIRLMCIQPAQLCGVSTKKGKIAEGYDADFCIWDPDEEFTITPDKIKFKNKFNPYMGKRLKGVVKSTIVRGLHVYQDGAEFGQPLGKIIDRNKGPRKVITWK